MECFKALCIKSEGVLYEVITPSLFEEIGGCFFHHKPCKDGNIQIGLKTEFQRGMGRLILHYGNTTQAPITQFATIISPVNYLSIQIQEIASVIRPMAQVSLTSRVSWLTLKSMHHSQEQQLINVACLTEFADALPIQVSFLVNGKSQNLSLRLPVVLTKFVEPATLDSTGFFSLWKKLAGPPYGIPPILS